MKNSFTNMHDAMEESNTALEAAHSPITEFERRRKAVHEILKEISERDEIVAQLSTKKERETAQEELKSLRATAELQLVEIEHRIKIEKWVEANIQAQQAQKSHTILTNDLGSPADYENAKMALENQLHATLQNTLISTQTIESHAITLEHWKTNPPISAVNQLADHIIDAVIKHEGMLPRWYQKQWEHSGSLLLNSLLLPLTFDGISRQRNQEYMLPLGIENYHLSFDFWMTHPARENQPTLTFCIGVPGIPSTGLSIPAPPLSLYRSAHDNLVNAFSLKGAPILSRSKRNTPLPLQSYIMWHQYAEALQLNNLPIEETLTSITKFQTMLPLMLKEENCPPLWIKELDSYMTFSDEGLTLHQAEDPLTLRTCPNESYDIAPEDLAQWEQWQHAYHNSALEPWEGYDKPLTLPQQLSASTTLPQTLAPSPTEGVGYRGMLGYLASFSTALMVFRHLILPIALTFTEQWRTSAPMRKKLDDLERKSQKLDRSIDHHAINELSKNGNIILHLVSDNPPATLPTEEEVRSLLNGLRNIATMRIKKESRPLTKEEERFNKTLDEHLKHHSDRVVAQVLQYIATPTVTKKDTQTILTGMSKKPLHFTDAQLEELQNYMQKVLYPYIRLCSERYPEEATLEHFKEEARKNFFKYSEEGRRADKEAEKRKAQQEAERVKAEKHAAKQKAEQEYTDAMQGLLTTITTLRTDIAKLVQDVCDAQEDLRQKLERSNILRQRATKVPPRKLTDFAKHASEAQALLAETLTFPEASSLLEKEIVDASIQAITEQRVMHGIEAGKSAINSLSKELAPLKDWITQTRQNGLGYQLKQKETTLNGDIRFLNKALSAAEKDLEAQENADHQRRQARERERAEAENAARQALEQEMRELEKDIAHLRQRIKQGAVLYEGRPVTVEELNITAISQFFAKRLEDVDPNQLETQLTLLQRYCVEHQGKSNAEIQLTPDEQGECYLALLSVCRLLENAAIVGDEGKKLKTMGNVLAHLVLEDNSVITPQKLIKSVAATLCLLGGLHANNDNVKVRNNPLLANQHRLKDVNYSKRVQDLSEKLEGKWAEDVIQSPDLKWQAVMLREALLQMGGLPANLGKPFSQFRNMLAHNNDGLDIKTLQQDLERLAAIKTYAQSKAQSQGMERV